MKCKNCRHDADQLYYSGAGKEPDLCESCYLDLCGQQEQDHCAEQTELDSYELEG